MRTKGIFLPRDDVSLISLTATGARGAPQADCPRPALPALPADTALGSGPQPASRLSANAGAAHRAPPALRSRRQPGPPAAGAAGGAARRHGAGSRLQRRNAARGRGLRGDAGGENGPAPLRPAGSRGGSLPWASAPRPATGTRCPRGLGLAEGRASPGPARPARLRRRAAGMRAKRGLDPPGAQHRHRLGRAAPRGRSGELANGFLGGVRGRRGFRRRTSLGPLKAGASPRAAGLKVRKWWRSGGSGRSRRLTDSPSPLASPVLSVPTTAALRRRRANSRGGLGSAERNLFCA